METLYAAMTIYGYGRPVQGGNSISDQTSDGD